MTVLFIILIVLIIISVIYFIFSSREDMRDFNKEKEKTFNIILRKTDNALKRLNIPYFLSSGTLLGYYRENNYLKHDYDIDIGIFRENYSKEIKREMKKEGFINYRNLGDLERGYEMSFYLPKTKVGRYAKIDIFVHNREEVNGKKYIYWATYQKPKYIKRIKYRVSSFGLKKVLFKGIEVNVPVETEKYLVEHYGVDWRIPKIAQKGEYYYATSPKSIILD